MPRSATAAEPSWSNGVESGQRVEGRGPRSLTGAPGATYTRYPAGMRLTIGRAGPPHVSDGLASRATSAAAAARVGSGDPPGPGWPAPGAPLPRTRRFDTVARSIVTSKVVIPGSAGPAAGAIDLSRPAARMAAMIAPAPAAPTFLTVTGRRSGPG